MPQRSPTVSDTQVDSDSVGLVTPLNHHALDSGDGHVHVLHVDDEPEFVEMTADFLERLSDDFVVTTETTAEDGLARLAEAAVDCVVSDYQMPETDGLEFLEAVRAEHPDLPFVLFTGEGSEEVASEAIASGVTEYLQKESGTSQYEVLANRIRNAVDQYWTEQELWNTLSWYQRLVEQELAGIYLIQAEEFIYVNERLADIFGYSQAELVGRSPRTVIADADHAELVENLRRREAGEVDDIRYTLTGERKDGSHIDLEVHGGVIEFEDKPAVLGLLLDVSDRV